ncbi:hypothetical protein A0J61_08107 [Choanephora cucurbitarum]|uniref:Uncharacterized protein n=1 Tax=Choanephora cucurbitarum TaxID=101091 RepID=A0A1C7N436_9FUNG|nr:hypothetical protein A0J61_08107 [Choanephora cucurbitarum]
MQFHLLILIIGGQTVYVKEERTTRAYVTAFHNKTLGLRGTSFFEINRKDGTSQQCVRAWLK